MNLFLAPAVALILSTSLLAIFPTSARSEPAAVPAAANPMTLTFNGVDFLHRWSKNGQNEFTPTNEADLAKWIDMVTINVHDNVTDGEQLAALANSVLGNYQKHGRVLKTNSVPRTESRPAEHLIVAVLGNQQLLETAFARCVLIDKVGTVVVYSHRVYGSKAGPAMSEWLKANGQKMEDALMEWNGAPAATALKLLPQGE